MKIINYLIILLIFLNFNLSFTNDKLEIKNYIVPCEFMIFLDSISNSIDTAHKLLKRFYGNNYEQIVAQISEESKLTYGVDILNKKYFERIGVDINKPVAYVHIEKDKGYLLLPINSKKNIQTFIDNNFKNSLPYKFAGNYLILSENTQNIQLNNKTIEEIEGFKLSLKRLNFNWDKPFIWLDSRYLTGVSSSIVKSTDLKIPYGFTSILFRFTDKQIQLKIYAALITENQKQFIANMKNIKINQDFEFLDYLSEPSFFIGSVYLNTSMLYKYYTYIDTINILGIKGLINELRTKYQINVENDIINNSDGRIKLVLRKIDTINNNYIIYGSIGIIDKQRVDNFVESIKNLMASSGNQMDAFELFTIPFYNYKSSNYNIYFGLVKNDFIFSTDKDILVKTIKNIFENKGGYLDNLPIYFKRSSESFSPGYYATIDIPNLFSELKSSIMINKDLFIGIKNINIYGNPDLDDDAYGWNTTIDINFYK